MYYVIAKIAKIKRRMCLHLKKKEKLFQILLFDSKEIKQSEFKQA